MNDVMSVTYSDSLANVDSFDMTVNNWDAATGLRPDRLQVQR